MKQRIDDTVLVNVGITGFNVDNRGLRTFEYETRNFKYLITWNLRGIYLVGECVILPKDNTGDKVVMKFNDITTLSGYHIDMADGELGKVLRKLGRRDICPFDPELDDDNTSSLTCLYFALAARRRHLDSGKGGITIKDLYWENKGEFEKSIDGGYPVYYTNGLCQVQCASCATEKLNDLSYWLRDDIDIEVPTSIYIIYSGESTYCDGCNTDVTKWGDDNE